MAGLYVRGDPATKKEAAQWVKDGKRVELFDPAETMGLGTAREVPKNGSVPVCGPQYPKPHRWYGTATIREGVVISIK